MNQFMIMSEQIPKGALPQIIQKLLEGSELNDIEFYMKNSIILVKDLMNFKKYFINEQQNKLKIFFFKKKKKNKRIDMFYRHHFADVANKMGVRFSISIIQISNQQNSFRKIKSGKKTGQKSFNHTYIKLILESYSFQAVVSRYFIEQNRKDCKKKSKKLIQSCWKIIHKTDIISRLRETKVKKIPSSSILHNCQNLSPQIGLESDAIKQSAQKYVKPLQNAYPELQHYFLSSKCKIPWSDREPEDVKSYAHKDLELLYYPA